MNNYLKMILMLLVVLLAAVSARSEALVTQQITLRPGWNAIWVEVTPTNGSPSAVFAGMNIESAWGWSVRQTTANFISDPNEAEWNRDAMLMFVPTNRVESFQNNLFGIQPNRPYLVKSLAGVPMVLSITGSPALDRPAWTPEVFNLRGFPVDSATAPTFLNFFKSSVAQYTAATSTLEKIFALRADGVWAEAGAGDTMQAGVAYWVKCKGSSDFMAPVEATVAVLKALNFERTRTELELSLLNRRATTGTVSIAGLNIGGWAFSEVAIDGTNGFVSVPITNTLTKTLAPSETLALKVQIKRTELPSDEFGGVVVVTDGEGTRINVPLSATRTATPAGDESVQQAKMRAGLWLGYVTVDGVSEAHSGPLTTILKTNQSGLVHEEKIRTGVGQTPTPVATPMQLKMILHVDTNGVTRLLKEVALMFAEGSYTNDTDGFRVPETAGRYVLITEESLIPLYRGVAAVEDRVVGRRLSTADFDFPVAAGANYLTLAGNFAYTNTVSGLIELSTSFPTNPFRHKFHPDHDNLGPNYVSASVRPEVYGITRQIELTPTPSDPGGITPTGYGDSSIGGTYREVVTGLHRVPIVTSGTFSMRRLNQIGVLNQ